MEDPQGGASGSFETRLESTLDSVDEAEASVLRLAQQVGFQEEDLHKIGMAVREAMVNAVVHGNRYNLKKHVHLAASTAGGRLDIKIADEGEGFEDSDLPDPLAEENLLRQSGRGLLLIKAFVDEFRIRRLQPPLGTELNLVIHRSQHAVSEQGG